MSELFAARGAITVGMVCALLSEALPALAYDYRKEPLYVALQKFDKGAVYDFDQNLRAYAADKAWKEKTVEGITTLAQRIVPDALAKTSDAAVSKYGAAFHQLLVSLYRINPDACSYRLAGVPEIEPKRYAETLSALPKEVKDAGLEALVLLFSEAAGKPDVSNLNDLEEYRRILRRIDAESIRRFKTSVGFLPPDSAVTSKQRCAAGINFYAGMLALKDPERSFMLRITLIDP